MEKKSFIEKVFGEDRYLKARKNRAYRFSVDTTASLIFYNSINAVNELAIAGADIKACLKARAVGSLINVATARVYGKYRDWLYRMMEIEENSSSFKKLATDTFALATYGTPLYLSNLALAGFEKDQIAAAVTASLVYSCFIGRPYGIFLDWFRKGFGLDPAEISRKEFELYKDDI